MVDSSGANRIELECQVLSAALRASWQSEDGSGRAKSCLELAQLFPDLVTPFDGRQTPAPRNNYLLLDIACDVTPRKVIIAYFKHAKKFLRENNPRQKRMDYFQLLDAGFVLRKPRLRLSHDLVVSRAQLIEKKLILANGTFEMIEVPGMAAEAAAAAVSASTEAAAAVAGAMPAAAQATGGAVPPLPLTPAQAAAQGHVQAAAGSPPQQPGVPPQAPAQIRLPAIIELLRSAQLIAGPEVQALTNQMRSFPGVSVVELILSAGYVTESEMKSVQLGEFLLGQGKINLGQFCVAMYDERSTGVKMAESLQTRGWLRPE